MSNQQNTQLTWVQAKTGKLHDRTEAQSTSLKASGMQKLRSLKVSSDVVDRFDSVCQICDVWVKKVENLEENPKEKAMYRACPACDRVIGNFGANFKVHVSKCSMPLYEEIVRCRPEFFVGAFPCNVNGKYPDPPVETEEQKRQKKRKKEQRAAKAKARALAAANGKPAPASSVNIPGSSFAKSSSTSSAQSRASVPSRSKSHKTSSAAKAGASSHTRVVQQPLGKTAEAPVVMTLEMEDYVSRKVFMQSLADDGALNTYMDVPERNREFVEEDVEAAGEDEVMFEEVMKRQGAATRYANSKDFLRELVHRDSPVEDAVDPYQFDRSANTASPSVLGEYVRARRDLEKEETGFMKVDRELRQVNAAIEKGSSTRGKGDESEFDSLMSFISESMDMYKTTRNHLLEISDPAEAMAEAEKLNGRLDSPQSRLRFSQVVDAYPRLQRVPDVQMRSFLDAQKTCT